MATKLNFLQYTYRFRINHKTLYSQTFPGPHFGSWTIMKNLPPSNYTLRLSDAYWYSIISAWNDLPCSGPSNGPLTRYVKLRVAHAPGMPETFYPAADFKGNGNRLPAIPACITARAWRTCRDACRDRLPSVAGKTFPAFPAHAHPQCYVSGKRPIAWTNDE